ncbi:MAG: hypothetical protein BYD32DRAFT_459971 [Podila humilis]|nr:MAG: hypothetical protein BYD32DRAFT_459971 [Podila humilis]
MREALCTNQQAMCFSSCQSKVETNTCNFDSLAWTCTCSSGIVPTVPSYQFPIPFKLCRNELRVCLESCIEAKTSQRSLPEQQQKRRFEAEQRPLFIPNANEDTAQVLAQMAEDDDFDQDDFDAIDEIHLLRQKSRLESDPYYRSGNDGPDFVSPNKQRRILHKQRWLDSQTQNPSKIEKGSLAVHNTILQNSDCAAKCDAKLACGSESSPDYSAGLDSVSPM